MNFKIAPKSETAVKSHLLTKERDSLILGKGNDIGQKVNLAAINALQEIPWEINEDILEHLFDTLKPADKALTYSQEANRLKSYNLLQIETNNVIEYLLEQGNKFWFGWKYDKRGGRSYSQGYHINPQGNEYRKAMLQFSDKKLLTVKGMRYLKYDIANHMGHDKKTWLQRTMEANKVINDIFKDMRSYERKVREYALLADNPLLFRKAINAWKVGVIQGEPIGHNMGLDCTASGESPSLVGILF